jgi:putative membrane protein
MEGEHSRKLMSDGATVQQNLQGLTGADFDRAYIANEVALHQQVLDMIDQTLIPAAQNQDLKNLLTQVRPAVAAHLEHARQVQSGLSATTQATGQ